MYNTEILVFRNTEYPNPSNTWSSRHLHPGRIWQWAVIEDKLYLGIAPNTSDQNIKILLSVATSEVCFTYHPVCLVKWIYSLKVFHSWRGLQINFQNFNYSFNDIWLGYFSNKSLNVTFLKLQRLILNRLSGKLGFLEWLISACVPIGRMLVSSHQELLISTLLSNNETGNRCKITKKWENPEQITSIPKRFLKLFFNQHITRKRCRLSSKSYFPVIIFQHSLKNPQNHKRSLKAFYLPLPLCSKCTNLKQKTSENNYNGEQSSF